MKFFVLDDTIMNFFIFWDCVCMLCDRMFIFSYVTSFDYPFFFMHYFYMKFFQFSRIEHNSFTKSEAQAFTQLCRVIVMEFLPFIENCLSVFFPKDKVQKLIACNSLQSRTQKDHPTSDRDPLIIGINARKMAEPLRSLVPELFEEIEKEEMLKSMSNVQRLLGETTDTVTDANLSLKKPVSDGDENGSLVSDPPVNEEGSDSHPGPEASDPPETDVPPYSTDLDPQGDVNVDSHTDPVDDGSHDNASGWSDFAFDDDKS